MARSVNTWMGESLVFSAGSIKKQSLALFLLRLPAFVPLIFVARGWLDLNAKDVLTAVLLRPASAGPTWSRNISASSSFALSSSLRARSANVTVEPWRLASKPA